MLGQVEWLTLSPSSGKPGGKGPAVRCRHVLRIPDLRPEPIKRN